MPFYVPTSRCGKASFFSSAHHRLLAVPLDTENASRPEGGAMPCRVTWGSLDQSLDLNCKQQSLEVLYITTEICAHLGGKEADDEFHTVRKQSVTRSRIQNNLRITRKLLGDHCIKLFTLPQPGICPCLMFGDSPQIPASTA